LGRRVLLRGVRIQARGKKAFKKKRSEKVGLAFGRSGIPVQKKRKRFPRRERKRKGQFHELTLREERIYTFYGINTSQAAASSSSSRAKWKEKGRDN